MCRAWLVGPLLPTDSSISQCIQCWKKQFFFVEQRKERHLPGIEAHSILHPKKTAYPSGQCNYFPAIAINSGSDEVKEVANTNIQLRVGEANDRLESTAKNTIQTDTIYELRRFANGLVLSIVH